MTIPKKVKIGGHEYYVTLAPTWDTFETGDCAETKYEEGIIYVNSNLIDSEQGSAFLHETMHVMNKTLNHELLDSISEQFYQVLSDNNLLK